MTPPLKFGTFKDLEEKLGGKKRFTVDDCPFCRDLKNNERILWKGKYWAIIYNLYPYIDGEQHIMLIPIRHTNFSHEITSIEYCELSEAYSFIEDYYSEDQYFSFTRESMANRSVEHIHTHFLPGKLKRSKIVELMREQGYDTRE